jgi:hypothetical protein
MPSTNVSLVGCFDNLGTKINQVQLCEYAKSVGQISGEKQGVSSSTPYSPKQAYHYSGRSRLFVG